MTRKTRLKAKVSSFSKRLSAAGDISRLSVLYTLAFQPMDVRELIDITGIPNSLMSHHLKQLYETGWVDKKKYGKRIEYRIQPKAFSVFEELFKDTPMGRNLWKKEIIVKKSEPKKKEKTVWIRITGEKDIIS